MSFFVERDTFWRAPAVRLDLAQADRVGRDLDALVVADVLQRLVEREPVVRDELDLLVGARGADVGLLLLAHRVDVEVLGAGVLADHHALVDLLARADEQLAALLQLASARTGGLRRGGRRRASRSARVRISPAHGS